MQRISFFWRQKFYSAFGIIVIFCVFPFFFQNGYQNITISRALFFGTVSTIVFSAYLIDLSINGSIAEAICIRIYTHSATDASMCLFAIGSFISLCSSEHFSASLYGDAGRYMGFVLYVSFFMSYIWISGSYKLRETHFMAACAVLCIICFFSLLQFFGFDVFNLIESVSPKARKNFISPFGNINVFSEYLCTFAPFTMCMFCKESVKNKSWFYFAVSVISFLGLFVSNSDSGYIGYGLTFILLFFFCSESSSCFKRFLMLCFAFFVSSFVFGFFQRLIKSSRGLSRLTELITEPKVAVCMVVFFAIAFFLIPEKSDKILLSLRKSVTVFLVFAFTICISAFIYFSCFNTSVYIGSLEKFFRFNDSWGTDRGFIWKSLLQVYKKAPLKRKIFGFGEESIPLIMAENFKHEMLDIMKYITDNAHNEFLHYLLCNGLFGLCAYIAIIISSLRTCINSQNIVIKKAFFFSIASYCIQSFFNITQPITTPYIFILFALSQCESDTFSEITMTNIQKKQKRKEGN